MVKNPLANADVRNAYSIPGSGRSSGEGNGNPLSILAWRIPWTEAPGGLQSRGREVSVMTEATEHLARSAHKSIGHTRENKGLRLLWRFQGVLGIQQKARIPDPSFTGDS